MRGRGAEVAGVVVGYALLVLFLVWPLPLDLGGRLLGHPDVDVWNHIWGFWWFDQALRETGRIPLETDLLAHPRGGRLYFIDPLNALLSVPIQRISTLPVAWNLVLCFELWLAAVAAHLVARAAGATARGAAFAGVLLGLAPFLRCEAHNGITEVLNVGWLGLSAAATTAALRRRSALGLGIGGLLAGVAFIACWYYGLAAAGLAATLIAVELLVGGGGVAARARVLGGAALFGLGAVAASLQHVRSFWWSLQGTDAIIGRTSGKGVSPVVIAHNATDLWSFVHPGPYRAPDLRALYGEGFLHTTYLGAVALLLGVLALALRVPHAGRWAVLALGSAVLALGPYLYAGGAFVRVDGRPLVLPFYAITQVLGLVSITHPARLVSVTLFALGALSALGWSRLEARFPRASRVAWPAALGALFLELWLVAPGPWPLPTSNAALADSTAALRADSHPGAVLDLPTRSWNTMAACRFLYEQTGHGRPIPWMVDVRAERAPGISGPGPLQDVLRLADMPGQGAEDLQAIASARFAAMSDADLQNLVRAALLAKGFRAVVLHTDFLAPPAGVWPFRAVFDRAFGPPERFPDGSLLYWVGVPAPSAVRPPAPGPAPRGPPGPPGPPGAGGQNGN